MANLIKTDPTEKLDIRTFVKYVPDINEEYFEGTAVKPNNLGAEARIFLVHAPYDQTLSKVVYILRDPRDVMVSYWHFKRLTEKEFKLSLREFIESDDHWPCRWDDHVAGWLDNDKHSNILVVRYEELHNNPVHELIRILNFSGLSYTKDKIESAIETSRLENMQVLEKKFGFALNGAQGLRGERFVRRGQIGGWRNELDDTCLRILEDKYSPVMGMVGYAPITK